MKLKNQSFLENNEMLFLGKKLEEFDLSPIYINLGYSYMKKGLYEEAKKSCNEGHITARVHTNEESLNEANVCLKEIKKLAQVK